mmetsp:Transcript_22579/g.85573  ORF Transcript_22579/g.85573 Transcript_22579/m.85573 type:complete len:204 (+) Transcript_22579:5739-6350(+)
MSLPPSGADNESPGWGLSSQGTCSIKRPLRNVPTSMCAIRGLLGVTSSILASSGQQAWHPAVRRLLHHEVSAGCGAPRSGQCRLAEHDIGGRGAAAGSGGTWEITRSARAASQLMACSASSATCAHASGTSPSVPKHCLGLARVISTVLELPSSSIWSTFRDTEVLAIEPTLVMRIKPRKSAGAALHLATLKSAGGVRSTENT